MRNPSICIAAAALLAALPAHAQNKCVDAKGKVTYQQEPCPGSTVRPAPSQSPAPARSAAPSAPVEPASAAPATRAEIEAAQERESPALRAIREQGRTTCARMAQQIAEAQAALPQLAPEKRANLEQKLANAEREYAKTCQR